MSTTLFLCPQCRSGLDVAPEYTGDFECSCGFSVAVTRGVPLFLIDQQDSGKNSALAESTFRKPAGYERLISIKSGIQRAIAQRDARIGIAEFVNGASVLDVGCGPSLDLPSAENDHETADCYYGVDASAEFVLAARDNHPGAKYRFAQADTRALPFADNSFDTVLASFTIHHVAGDPASVVHELTRVARRHIVIYDHLRAAPSFKRRIQDTYWKYFDGGENYLTAEEWGSVLADLSVRRSVRSGVLFGHVVKFACDAPDTARSTDFQSQAETRF